MNRTEARDLALTLMDEFGLTGWTFRFDRARRRLGCCNYTHRRITLSGPLTDLNDRAEVEEVIRHEIAHALVGPGHGHGARWKAACVKTGARPKACSDSATTTPPAWIGRCSTDGCDFEVGRLQLRGKVRESACPRCCKRAGVRYSPDFKLRWERNRAYA